MRELYYFCMLLGNLPRFSLRLDVLRNRTATGFNILECYYSQLLFLFPNKILSEQHVVWYQFRYKRTNHRPFLNACGKLAAIFSTLGCFEEACSDFATL